MAHPQSLIRQKSFAYRSSRPSSRIRRAYIATPHDFAEDGRPGNYLSLREVYKSTYPTGTNIHYAALNQRDRGLSFEHAQGQPKPSSFACQCCSSKHSHFQSHRERISIRSPTESSALPSSCGTRKTWESSPCLPPLTTTFTSPTV